MDQNLQSISVGVGTLAGTVTWPLFRVPKSTSSFGGITLTGAYLQTNGTATNELQLTVGTALGTASTGTIGTLNGTLVAGVGQAFTITTAYVASGSWIQIKTGAGGGLPDMVNNVTIEYKWGK
jgi:hypothetical protein